VSGPLRQYGGADTQATVPVTQIPFSKSKNRQIPVPIYPFITVIKMRRGRLNLKITWVW
jgi:hypothetical protein